MKEEKARKQKQIIYLDDLRIRYPDESGRTSIKRELDLRHSGESSIDSVSDHFDNYFVYGTAIKHIADITLHEGRSLRGVILFEGNIQVYKEGMIPETEVNGLYNLTSDSGKIWATTPNSRRYRGKDGLKLLVFGSIESERGKSRRIEAIVRGYEIQRKQKVERFKHLVKSVGTHFDSLEREYFIP